MARDIGGGRENPDRADDWQRIESEQADRDRLGREYDAKHDPGLMFELMANRPGEYSRRESRTCPPEVAAAFGRTPEQIEALKDAEGQRRQNRAAALGDDWTERFLEEQAARFEQGVGDPTDETAAERKERFPNDRGTLITVEGRRVLEVPLTQTDDGPVQRHGGSSMLGIPACSPVDTHIEAHAAALMRARGTKYAELYVTREPCPGRSGCESLLPTMLAPRTALVVRNEDGLFNKTFVGKADDENGENR